MEWQWWAPSHFKSWTEARLFSIHIVFEHIIPYGVLFFEIDWSISYCQMNISIMTIHSFWDIGSFNALDACHSRIGLNGGTFLVSQYSVIPKWGSNSRCRISLAYWILADLTAPTVDPRLPIKSSATCNLLHSMSTPIHALLFAAGWEWKCTGPGAVEMYVPQSEGEGPRRIDVWKVRDEDLEMVRLHWLQWG